MSNRRSALLRFYRHAPWLGLVTICGVCANGQTASTGALSGVALGPSGAVLVGLSIRLTDDAGRETRSTTSDEEGRFAFLLLPPGTYQLQTDKSDFQPLRLSNLHIAVTETLRVELRIHLPNRFERVEAISNPLLVQIDTSALGRVVNEAAVSGLPLVTRNFAQIAGLSPGVVVGVYNAGELGLAEGSEVGHGTEPPYPGPRLTR